jgi:hypothetical protein
MFEASHIPPPPSILSRNSPVEAVLRRCALIVERIRKPWTDQPVGGWTAPPKITSPVIQDATEEETRPDGPAEWAESKQTSSTQIDDYFAAQGQDEIFYSFAPPYPSSAKAKAKAKAR